MCRQISAGATRLIRIIFIAESGASFCAMITAEQTIAVFGATGRTGWRICEHARAAGHTLSLLVRDPARLRGEHTDVYDDARVTTGDVLNIDSVNATVAGADAIVSALGSDDFRAPGATLSQGMLNIVAAAQRHGVRRIIAIAGGGVLDSPNGGLRSEQPGYPAVFAAVTLAHQGTWRALRESGLDWTLVCTPDLTEAPRTGQFRVLADLMPVGGKQISRDDLAHWMIEQLNRREFVGKRVGAAN